MRIMITFVDWVVRQTDLKQTDLVHVTYQKSLM